MLVCPDIAVEGVFTPQDQEPLEDAGPEENGPLPALRGACGPLHGVVQQVHQQGAQVLVGEGQLLGDEGGDPEGHACGAGPPGGVLENGVDHDVVGVQKGRGGGALLLPVVHTPLQPLQVPGLEHGVDGQQAVLELVAQGGALPHLLLQRPVVVHDQLVAQGERLGLPLGAEDGVGQFPGGQQGADHNCPQRHPIEDADHVSASEEAGRGPREGVRPGVVPDRRKGGEGQHAPHADSGEDSKCLPEAAPALEGQIDRHDQGGQDDQPRPGQGGQDRLGQGVPLVPDRQMLNRAQRSRQHGQEQLPVWRAPGRVHQKQPPEQDQHPGRHLCRKPVAADVREAKHRRLRNGGGRGGGAQDHGESLPASDGQRELDRAQLRALHGGEGDGVPHLPSIEIDGGLQTAGVKHQPRLPGSIFRKGEGELI